MLFKKGVVGVMVSTNFILSPSKYSVGLSQDTTTHLQNSFSLCCSGCEDLPGVNPGRVGKRAEPVPGTVLHHTPQSQRDHLQRVHGQTPAGQCPPPEPPSKQKGEN